ncbi:MAG TPA: lipocalin-like domain-containing protein [Longimicrobiales bacterium]|nr:lipocalin-like domain-containing protein [Longimicrobiales bacterium]
MRPRRLLVAFVLAVVLAGGAVLALAGGGPGGTEVQATISAADALGGGDTAGYARTVAPRAFEFPRDHGPHPGFRNEWWYFTGNLDGPGGRRFGYQLTFFRTALAPMAAPRASEWGATEVYMAHLALTDERGHTFRAYDRFARAAAGLAGARRAPFRVWLEDWRAEPASRTDGLGLRAAGAGLGLRADGAPFPLHLRASEGDVAVDLRLGEGKPPVLQGDRGLSRKGPEPGNASYYYSLTRMPTAGTIRMAGDTFRVRGESWMDREWSTSALGRDEVGWDWFALQLADGRELMLYRIRRRDGGASPFSAGSVVAPDGAATPLSPADARLDVLGHWTSPGGTRYPARWRLRVPTAGLDLEVRPILADQELNVAVRYWEGAVDVTGTSRGKPVRGRGYVELTGYGETTRPETGAARR